jgi:hypothetical protein
MGSLFHTYNLQIFKNLTIKKGLTFLDSPIKINEMNRAIITEFQSVSATAGRRAFS